MSSFPIIGKIQSIAVTRRSPAPSGKFDESTSGTDRSPQKEGRPASAKPAFPRRGRGPGPHTSRQGHRRVFSNKVNREKNQTTACPIGRTRGRTPATTNNRPLFIHAHPARLLTTPADSCTRRCAGVQAGSLQEANSFTFKCGRALRDRAKCDGQIKDPRCISCPSPTSVPVAKTCKGKRYKQRKKPNKTARRSRCAFQR